LETHKLVIFDQKGEKTMNSKMLLIVITVAVLMVGPVYASGCRGGHFIGAYVSSPNTPTDLFGDGTVIHNFVFQLNLGSDGSATQYWTGLPDYFLTLGTGSPQIGSWSCRNDGKLIVTLLAGGYAPIAPGPNNPTNDVSLLRHLRTTYLFTVDDDNTLTRIQSRSRVYAPADDASIATGGTLATLHTDTVQYKRLVASDADLLAP
jgi:hypothetical protein